MVIECFSPNSSFLIKIQTIQRKSSISLTYQLETIVNGFNSKSMNILFPNFVYFVLSPYYNWLSRFLSINTPINTQSQFQFQIFKVYSCLQMQKFINLSETPFIDLRKKTKHSSSFTVESQLPSANLPQNQEQIKYKIHTNFTTYDEKPYLVPDQSDQKIISEILAAAKEQFRFGYDLQTSKRFKQLSLKHVDMVAKYLKQSNPQAVFIALRAQIWDRKYTISLGKLKQITKKTLYPLLLSQIVPILLNSLDDRETSTGFEYLDRILKLGLPEAFLWKGIYETNYGDGKIAYQMLKNAQRLGYEPAAYKYLGQLFTGKNLYFPANLKVADKYFNKAKQAGAYIQPYLQNQIQHIQNQKRKQKLKADSIKSTEDTRAVQLTNFLGNKMKEFKFPKSHDQMTFMSSTSIMANPQSVTFFNSPKTFYVVFSPLMNFPGRHFFVKDIDGSLQYVSIYNWDQIPTQKLKLLHEVGTKIVLNDYIRKTGANDQLPFYRVDDPHSVEFYERTNKHTITDKQFRNYAKNLFQRNLLDKAMNIYEYMVMKGSEEMQIVYSNMGVIYQRQSNIPKAIKCYQDSLKVKKYNKSQLRLTHIYISIKQFDKTEEIIKDIESPQQREQLIQLIQKIKEKQNDVSNFSITVKNKNKIKKQLYNDANSKFSKISNPNPTCASNIREDRWNLLRFKQLYEQALGVKGLPEEKYLDLIQSVYNAIENPSLTKEAVERFFKMTSIAYKIHFDDLVHPCSASYFAHVIPSAMFLTKVALINEVITVFYMSKRQNYLQNRIEDLCLGLEEKGQYKEAEGIYRYSGNYCAPFNVKVAEMLFLQGKYEQCEKYCITTIQFMSKFETQKFFKYIADLAVWHLKSLIRQEKYEFAVNKGEQYIKEFEKKNPKLTYEDHIYKNGVIKFPSSKGQPLFPDLSALQEVKDIVSGKQLMQNIYRQIIRAFISLKDPTKAKFYLPKVLMKKQTSNYSELIEKYYQTKLLHILILKLQNHLNAIKQIDALIKEINNDKKLQSKQPYVKFLLKEKLSLLLQTGKISQVIKQSQDIVKINSVNFFFVKNKLFSFIKKNSSKTVQILDKINSSETLNCIWPELCERSKDYLKKSIEQKQEPEQKQTENVLISLQKIDLELQEDEEDKMYEQQDSKQIESFSFFYSQQQKATDFHDELQEEEYENEICRFQGKNGLTYVVIFDKELRSSLQVAEERKFVSAADHLCLRSYGSTGIKIFGTQIRLKIRGSGRLTGKLFDNPQDPKIKFCYLNKIQKHDDYKRQGNK